MIIPNIGVTRTTPGSYIRTFLSHTHRKHTVAIKALYSLEAFDSLFFRVCVEDADLPKKRRQSGTELDDKLKCLGRAQPCCFEVRTGDGDESD